MRIPVNPRRAVYPAIKAIKANATEMNRIWGRPGRVPRRDARGRVRLELAAGDEKTENQIDRWRELADFMRVIADQAADVRAFANEMVERLERGERF
jgi:hypothetical protein